MTDQTIPADKVREILEEWERTKEYADWEDMDNLVQDVRALLPTPPRPTLADMTPEARRDCQWMQADIIGGDEPLVITRIDRTDWSAVILDRNGRYDEVPAGAVTPRPDLPRLEWPGDTEAAPVPALPGGWRLADHKDHGRVLVVRTDGENAIYATPYKVTGIRTRVCLVSDLTFVDTDNDQKPEDAAPAKVGTVIESADDPRIDALPTGSILLDRDEEATMKRPWEWEGEGYIPIESDGDEFGPWTVLHIPKEGDQ